MLLQIYAAACEALNATFKRCRKSGCYERAIDGSKYCANHQSQPFWEWFKIIILFAAIAGFIYWMAHRS